MFYCLGPLCPTSILKIKLHNLHYFAIDNFEVIEKAFYGRIRTAKFWLWFYRAPDKLRRTI